MLSNVPYGVNGFRIIEDSRSPYFGLGNCRGDFQGTPNAFCLDDDSNNWAPRLGFAYDIGARGETVVRGGWGRFYDKIVANATLFTLIDAIGVRGVSLFDLPFGPNTIPTFDEIFASFGFPLPFDRIIPPTYEVPYSDQFTIGVSHQITPQIAVDVDYVRSEGNNRGQRNDLNEMRIPNVQESRLFNDGTGNDFRGRLRVVDPVGFDTYDGLQFSLRKRFSNRSQFTVNYTYADLRGNNESGFGEEAECRACSGDDRDVGPYRNDTTHNFITGGIYQFPGDWQISGLLQMESGRALTAEFAADANGNGRRASDWASMITSRPWEISSPRSSSERRNGVNTCAFSVSVSTKPKKRFSPQSVMPRATTIVASANVFPSRNSATTSSPVRSRSCISRSFAALACTNPRDTVELDSPMAPGIASAAAS